MIRKEDLEFQIYFQNITLYKAKKCIFRLEEDLVHQNWIKKRAEEEIEEILAEMERKGWLSDA